MNPGAFVVMLLIFAAGTLIFLAMKFRFNTRELQHRERLAALEKGAQLPEILEGRAPWSPRVYLLRGMLWLFSGIGVLVFLGALVAQSERAPSLEDRLRRAQDLKFMGATPEQLQKVMDDTTLRRDPPEALALLGLVPIGVGLAYLIFYRVESRNPLPRSQ